MKRLNRFFEAKKEYGPFFLRLVIGWRLIAGTLGYALHNEPIDDVASYFSDLHLPLPQFCAWLAVNAQFICGILFILGWWTLGTAIIMIINFSVAILAAHMNETIQRSFQAWILLAASIFFLFHGAGKISIDENKMQRANL
jgi:putative oxidoreductase